MRRLGWLGASLGAILAFRGQRGGTTLETSSSSAKKLNMSHILSTTRTSTKARLALADQRAVRADLFTLTGTTAITSFEGCVLRRSRGLGVYPVLPQYVPTYLPAMVRGEHGFTVSVCLNRTTVIGTCRVLTQAGFVLRRTTVNRQHLTQTMLRRSPYSPWTC